MSWPKTGVTNQYNAHLDKDSIIKDETDPDGAAILETALLKTIKRLKAQSTIL